MNNPVHVLPGTQLASADVRQAQHVFTQILSYLREQARPWAQSGLSKAIDDPYVIGKVGDLQIRIAVAEALIERAQHIAIQSLDAALVAVAIAEADIASAEALQSVSNAQLELTGSRDAQRSSPQREQAPLRWKFQVIGNYRLNGVDPQTAGVL